MADLRAFTLTARLPLSPAAMAVSAVRSRSDWRARGEGRHLGAEWEKNAEALAALRAVGARRWPCQVDVADRSQLQPALAAVESDLGPCPFW